jgi:hypothetical protein
LIQQLNSKIKPELVFSSKERLGLTETFFVMYISWGLVESSQENERVKSRENISLSSILIALLVLAHSLGHFLVSFGVEVITRSGATTHF